jgi:thiol-disulfide isomerase/thioredoxin
MRILFFIFSIFCASITLAQTSIIGQAKEFPNESIRVFEYEDFLTYKRKEILKTTSDSTGKFEFNLDVSNTKMITLQFKDFNTAFYVDSNQRYQFSLPSIDTSLIYFNEPLYISPQFEVNDITNINQLISDFNAEYESFVRKNLSSFVTKSVRLKVDTFCLQVKTKYAKINHDFFQNYVDYSLAVLEMTSTVNKKQLYQSKIHQSPVLYSNDAYMDFFNQFYSNIFKSFNSNDYSELIVALKVKMSINDIFSIFNRYDYLKNDTIKELVLLKSLYENYRNPEFSKKSILYVLNDIENNSSISEHQLIAKNISNKLSSVDIGSFAPDFTLTDLNGNKVTLSELTKNKYVYLDFWATWCSPCVKEMKLISDLKNKYGDYVTFVSISIDKNQRTMNRFVEKNKYDWTFLYFDDNQELIQQYKASAIPLYYLIAPGGRIVQSPAFRPSLIEPYLRAIEESTKKPSRRRN